MQADTRGMKNIFQMEIYQLGHYAKPNSPNSSSSSSLVANLKML